MNGSAYYEYARSVIAEWQRQIDQASAERREQAGTSADGAVTSGAAPCVSGPSAVAASAAAADAGGDQST